MAAPILPYFPAFLAKQTPHFHQFWKSWTPLYDEGDGVWTMLTIALVCTHAHTKEIKGRIDCMCEVW